MVLKDTPVHLSKCESRKGELASQLLHSKLIVAKKSPPKNRISFFSSLEINSTMQKYC